VPISQTGLNVLSFKPRVAFKDGFLRVAGSEHAQHVLDGKPSPANDRFAPEDLGAHRYAFEQFCFFTSLLRDES